jgi:hypothetical protein
MDLLLFIIQSLEKYKFFSFNVVYHTIIMTLLKQTCRLALCNLYRCTLGCWQYIFGSSQEHKLCHWLYHNCHHHSTFRTVGTHQLKIHNSLILTCSPQPCLQNTQNKVVKITESINVRPTIIISVKVQKEIEI